MKEFKDILRAKRKKMGYKQYELAEEMGVTTQAYNRWERGLKHPQFENLILLAETLGCSLDELMRGTTPSKDEVVHCKDCQYLYYKGTSAYCPHKRTSCSPDFFCGYAKRRKDKCL